MIPPISPAEVAAVFLAELLFGIGFNWMQVWLEEHKVWPTAISVVIGVMVTVSFPTLIWSRLSMDMFQATLLLTACFVGSGMPMIIGSTKRKAAENHKRHAWPTAAAQARDNAVMDLSVLADKAANNEITLPQLVNALHQVIGTLKSV